MLIVCPRCSARYLVADTVIGPAGRRVRCAACQHVWLQPATGEEAKRDLVRSATPPIPPAQEPSPQAAPPRAPQAPLAEASPSFERAASRPASFDFDRSRARSLVMAREKAYKNPHRRASVLTIVLVMVMVPLIIWLQKDAIKGLLPPQWFSHGPEETRAVASSNLVAGLRIHYGPPTPVERNGQQVLPINGTITNPTAATIPLPRMMGRLLDAEGREVYAWSFPPPAEQLTSGQTISFETLAEKVPINAANLNIAFEVRPPK